MLTGLSGGSSKEKPIWFALRNRTATTTTTATATTTATTTATSTTTAMPVIPRLAQQARAIAHVVAQFKSRAMARACYARRGDN